MHRSSLTGIVGIFACLVALFVCDTAQARPIEVDAGHWRLELQGVDVIDPSGSDGDFYVSGSVEYEMPTALDHLNFGLRAYPLFVYGGDDNTYAVAAGFTLRCYQHAVTRDGFYAEIGSGPIWLSRELEGNSSRVNFLSELGLGYKFPDKPWSLSLKYQHISNAGLSDNNKGVNAISFGVGYTF
jgi:hypothetical protein